MNWVATGELVARLRMQTNNGNPRPNSFGSLFKEAADAIETLAQAVGPTKLKDREPPPWNNPRRFWCDECASARGVDRAVEAVRRETIEECAAVCERRAACFAKTAGMISTDNVRDAEGRNCATDIRLLVNANSGERPRCFHVDAGKPCTRYLDGSRAERASIVAWLRWEADHRPSPTDQRLRDAADGVEAKEHLRQALAARQKGGLR